MTTTITSLELVVLRLFAGSCVGLAALSAGCNDPRCVERQERRYRRIEALVADIEKRDARRPRQIEWLVDTANRQQAERDARLQRTLRKISDRFDRDVHYLQNGDPVQKVWIGRAWNGHPENIPDVWSRLVF